MPAAEDAGLGNKDDDQTGAQDGVQVGLQDGGSESATARVRRVLIEPLSHLARPRGLQAGQHADNLDRLARKLRHMTGEGLAALRDLCLGQAGAIGVSKKAVPVCPLDGVILAWAYALEAPPITQSDYPASVMRSAMGRRAHDLGYGVELYRMACRLGPPPGSYLVTRLQDEARDNRLRREGLRRSVAAGEYVPPDRRAWLDAWHRDAALVESLIAEGDDRRATRAGIEGDAA